MSASKPLVAIVITNFNGKSILYKEKPVIYYSLSSVQKTNYKNYKCVFTDDVSTDDSVAYVRRIFKWVDVLVNKQNGGYTVNNNRGVKRALAKYNPDYIVLMNNDVIIKDRDWLRKLMAVAESSKDIGMVGCKFLYPNGNLQHAGEEMKWGLIPRNRGWNIPEAKRYSKIEDVEIMGQAVVLVKRSLIDRIGLWDENFKHGNDDIEYCMRARKAGFRNVYDGKVEIVHLEGFSLNSNPSKKRKKDYMFPVYQYQYMYLAFKQFDPIRVFGAIGLTLVGAIVGIGSGNSANLKLRNKIPWRLRVSLQAIGIAYKVNRGKLEKEEAFRTLMASKPPS